MYRAYRKDEDVGEFGEKKICGQESGRCSRGGQEGGPW